MAYKNSLRVALYARFSSDNQRSESIDAQVRAMTKYCKENNYKIVATYIDKAKSAMTDKRPFFQDLILDAFHSRKRSQNCHRKNRRNNARIFTNPEKSYYRNRTSGIKKAETVKEKINV